MHWSLLKWLPLFIWLLFCWSLQCLISALTQAGGGGLLLGFASSVTLRRRTGTAFPVYAAQAPSCSIRSVPCAALGSSPWVFHKSAEQKAAPALCAFPVRDAQAARSSRGTLSPARRAACPPHPRPQSPPALVGCLWPVSRGDSPGGCGPSRISGGLWLETGGLFAVR